MVRAFVICLFIVLSFSVNAQLTEEEREEYFPQEEFETFFTDLSMGLYMADAFAKGDFEVQRYFSLDVGYGYSYKLWKFYHAGFEYFPFSMEWFRFRQRPSKPTPGIHDKERYFSASMKLHAFNRIRFFYLEDIQQKGFFIDFGGGYNVPVIFQHKTINMVNGAKVKRISSGLEDRGWFNVFARIGISAFALRADYRLTRIFKEDYMFPDPPRLTFSFVIIPDIGKMNE